MHTFSAIEISVSDTRSRVRNFNRAFSQRDRDWKILIAHFSDANAIARDSYAIESRNLSSFEILFQGQKLISQVANVKTYR